MEDSAKYESSPMVAKLVLTLALANLAFLFVEIVINVTGAAM